MNISKNIIISYFYIKKTSAIYVAYVSGVERGGEGGGEKEWGFGKGRKRTPAVRPPPPKKKYKIHHIFYHPICEEDVRHIFSVFFYISFSNKVKVI